MSARMQAAMFLSKPFDLEELVRAVILRPTSGA